MQPKCLVAGENAILTGLATDTLHRAVISPTLEEATAEIAVVLDAKMRSTRFTVSNNRFGGLSPWQIRKVELFLDDHIDQTIHVKDLCRIVGLSAGYFSRAFRRSMGYSPHSYLIRRRVERAAVLMLTGDATLCEVAQASGFADQAHLCRQFRWCFGLTPAAWRRAHAEAFAMLRPTGRQASRSAISAAAARISAVSNPSVNLP
jgi:transcriptional regulator GlxA family with amidase domain